MILLAKNIDGVYSADPKVDPKAVKYDTITYDDVLAQHLQVMDSTATSLSMDCLLYTSCPAPAGAASRGRPDPDQSRGGGEGPPLPQRPAGLCPYSAGIPGRPGPQSGRVQDLDQG